MSGIKIPSLRQFREAVDHWGSARDSLVLKVGYLVAARASEICTRVSPSDFNVGQSYPYGKHMAAKLVKYSDGSPVLLVSVCCAKKRETNRKTGEKKLIFRQVPIPCKKEYEPWSIDLLKLCRADMLKRIHATGKDQDWGSLAFDLNPKTVCNITKRFCYDSFNFNDLSEVRNWLRHVRNIHLKRSYGLDAEKRSQYLGEDLAARGIGSRAIRYYDHDTINWVEIYPLLCKPLDKLMRESSMFELPSQEEQEVAEIQQ